MGTNQAIVEWCRQLLQVEPDIKGGSRGDIDVEVKIVKSLEHVVTLCFKVLLQRELVGSCMSHLKRPTSHCEVTFSCATWLGSKRGIAASCILGSCQWPEKMTQKIRTYG